MVLVLDSLRYYKPEIQNEEKLRNLSVTLMVILSILMVLITVSMFFDLREFVTFSVGHSAKSINFVPLSHTYDLPHVTIHLRGFVFQTESACITGLRKNGVTIHIDITGGSIYEIVEFHTGTAMIYAGSVDVAPLGFLCNGSTFIGTSTSYRLKGVDYFVEHISTDVKNLVLCSNHSGLTNLHTDTRYKQWFNSQIGMSEYLTNKGINRWCSDLFKNDDILTLRTKVDGITVGDVFIILSVASSLFTMISCLFKRIAFYLDFGTLDNGSMSSRSIKSIVQLASPDTHEMELPGSTDNTMANMDEIETMKEY